MPDSLATEREDLDALLARMGIEKYDLLLVGDGSGSTWERKCGWGCISIERDTMIRRAWYGAMSNGTINFAEVMAYIQPLSWYAQREMQQRKQGKATAIRQVHILTDSSYASGSKSKPDADLLTGANGILWGVFRQFAAQGIQVHWHWIQRETVELNRLADQISKKARLRIEDVDLVQEAFAKLPGESIYDFNPKD